MEDELKVKWRVDESLSGETEVLGGRSVPMPLRPPQIAETTFRHTQIKFASGAMRSNGRPRLKYVLEEQMLTPLTWCPFIVAANAPGLEYLPDLLSVQR